MTRATRRLLGLALSIAGALLLLHVGTTYAKGAVARERARSAWDAMEARRSVAAARMLVDESAPERALQRGAPVARLLIPRLGLDEIVVEGVGERELNAGPGHLPGSALPGERGNAVVSAHRDRHFTPLRRIATGDTVITETGRERAVWIVTARHLVAAGRPALHSTSEPTLTLTTCWPIGYLGSSPDRLLVTARLVARSARV